MDQGAAVVANERDRFARLFDRTAARVRAYARRHVRPDEVDEVVAETYLVAWRRREAVPPDDPMPWLLVTARNLIANRQRRHARGEQYGVDLDAVAGRAAAADATAMDRAGALAALAALTEQEREAVLLVAWDGLDHSAAATVAGCSVRAFTGRLHRARQRLTAVLAESGASGDPPARAARPRPIPSSTPQESR